MTAVDQAPTVRFAQPHEARVLARLMAEMIPDSRMSELGQPFLTLLHRHMIASRHCICIVAERHGIILGYAASALDTTSFYREFMLRRGPAAAALLFFKLFQPRQLQTIIRALTYAPQASANDPAAELLSIAVRPDAIQSGVGKAIFAATVDELRMRRIPSVKIVTGAGNDRANRFYRRVGAELLRSVPFYKNSQVNVWVFRAIEASSAHDS
jgi:ribosomal protein S18 acetylase RimI-like enzyme